MMHRPFPGMDPYLEDASLWPAFHARLVQSLYELLLPGLFDRYRALIAERRYHLDGAAQCESHVEIRQKADDKLITVLDVIGLANKTTGAGRQAYLERRKTCRERNASLVEIDLLLQGQPVWDLDREGLPDWDYSVVITRSVQPDRYEIYTSTLAKRLPRFRLPLAADDRDTVLDLQSAVTRACAAGGFEDRVDYSRDASAVFSPEHRARIHDILAPWRFENHEAIARIAYRLWEKAGRPHGRDQEHWQRAIEEIRRERRHA